MTIKQADTDLKKQLMNGDKTPDQVNNEKHYLLSLHCQVGHDASMRKLVLLNQLEY
jgi:hypothetical protein